MDEQRNQRYIETRDDQETECK